MPDQSQWDVPADIIAGSRAEYYAKKDAGEKDVPAYLKVLRKEYDYTMDSDDELLDWAANNMDWKDVKTFAELVPNKDKKVDYQEGWVNGDKEIICK